MSRQQTNDPNEAVSGGREPEDIMAEAIQILEGDEESIRHAFRYWHPYDLALVYRDAMITQRSRLLEVLDVDQLTGIMRELDPALQLESFQMLRHERAAEVLNRMDNDDLADTMAAVSVEAKEFLLSLMKREERDTVRQLLTYEPETAGGLMTNRYVWFYQRYTVREAVEKVKAFAELTKHVHYFYVVNEEKRLVGTLAYRELVLAGDGDDSILDE